jgi:hypothetical protein
MRGFYNFLFYDSSPAALLTPLDAEHRNKPIKHHINHRWRLGF